MGLRFKNVSGFLAFGLNPQNVAALRNPRDLSGL